MPSDYSSTAEVGQVVGTRAAPESPPGIGFPEHSGRAMFGKMQLHRLPGSLWNMQQKVNGIHVAANRLIWQFHLAEKTRGEN